MRRFLLSPLFLVLAGLPAPAGAAQESPGEYRLGPKDLLEIRVFEIPELNLERRVSDAGTIGLPLLGEFSVSGLTSSEVRERLQSALTAKYVNRANVSVVVKEYASKPVSILGAVQKPGSLTVSGQWPLLLAISAAGGLTERAGRKIYVLRRTDNGLSDTLEVNVDELFQGSSPIWNVPIFPSDVVNIPARLTVRVFCLGEVRQPGALEFDSDGRISLLSVLAKAGGLTDRASRTIRIKRQGPDGKDVETVVDFKRIISGKDPDPTLKPDDVVIVKESFF
ncbi:MAG: polysaccharide biosynthesis/export family protein [Thermoanaerobaculia bacterium]